MSSDAKAPLSSDGQGYEYAQYEPQAGGAQTYAADGSQAGYAGADQEYYDEAYAGGAMYDGAGAYASDAGAQGYTQAGAVGYDASYAQPTQAQAQGGDPYGAGGYGGSAAGSEPAGQVYAASAAQQGQQPYASNGYAAASNGGGYVDGSGAYGAAGAAGAAPYAGVPQPGVSQPGVAAGGQYPPPASTAARPKHGQGLTQRPKAQSPKKKEDRIDPSQIPRWSPEQKSDQPVRRFFTRSGQAPPPSTHPFLVVDEGNCSPRFIRVSTNKIANEGELIDQTKLCIGAIIQPLAELPHGEEQPRVVDTGTNGPIRCGTCRAYINPFFEFKNNGKTFVCNMCRSSNPVPDYYMCNLDPQGRRRDRNDRPELCFGSVDFVAPKDYCVNPVSDPCYLFVIDVSRSAVASGLVECALDCIRASAQELVQNPRARVGVITYSNAVNFYSAGQLAEGTSSEPRLDVVGDVDDVFVPVLPQNILPRLAEGKNTTLLDAILQLIPRVHGGAAARAECAVGAAAAAGYEVLRDMGGGKMILIQSNLPNCGVGKLAPRNDIKLYHTAKEADLLRPNGSYYEKLATQCAEARVSVDIYAGASAYIDLATIGTLSSTTAGQIYLYSGFSAGKDGEAFHRDMYRGVTRYTAFGGVMVIRTTRGLRMSEKFGNFFTRDGNEMEIAAVSCDSSFGVMLTHDRKITQKEAAIQTALLYTSPEGQRRIRVHTLSLPVTSALGNLFRFSDLDTIINLSLKQAVRQILYQATPQSARKAITQACVDSLYVYRKYCSTQHKPGQLILPEPLKLLPLVTLGMIKHPLFHSGLQADQRAFLSAFVNSMPTYVACSFVDPLLFSLTDIPDYACIESTDGRVFLPPVLKLSSESIKADGIYLLDNGTALYVWIGESVASTTTDQLFGVVQAAGGAQQQVQLLYDEKAGPESINARVWTLVTQLRKNCPSFKTINIITRNARTGASLDESLFFDHLIEDKGRRSKWNAKDIGSGKGIVCLKSYIDFLCFVHKEIQNKFKPSGY